MNLKRTHLIAIFSIIGGFIGFILRPTIPLIGLQLPLSIVITAGSTLKGSDEIVKPYAVQSLEYLIAGIILGGVVGFIYIDIVKNKQKTQKTEDRNIE